MILVVLKGAKQSDLFGILGRNSLRVILRSYLLCNSVRFVDRVRVRRSCQGSLILGPRKRVCSLASRSDMFRQCPACVQLVPRPMFGSSSRPLSGSCPRAHLATIRDFLCPNSFIRNCCPAQLHTSTGFVCCHRYCAVCAATLTERGHVLSLNRSRCIGRKEVLGTQMSEASFYALTGQNER